MSVRSGALRYFAQIKNGTTPASGEPAYWDGEVAWATPDDLGRLTGLYISETKRAVTPLAVAENNLNVVPANTVLMSTRAPIGHMAITTRPLTFNQGCRALIPAEGTWGPYLLYLLKARVPELNASANGTTFAELSRDDLAGVRVRLPPLESQKRIAAFLDEKTAQIDGLIEKKRALLARLAEKRQAIITQAVTKGLNPAAPMKDSGIDWLGHIPAHWKIKRVKHTAKLESGHTPDKKVSAYWDDGDIPWVSLNDTLELRANDYISATNYQTTSLGIENSSARILPQNAVVFTRDATIGECAITTRPMSVSQHIIAWICNEGVILPEYLLFLIYGMTEELRRLTNGATIGTIGLGDVRELTICLPSVEEQALIVAWVFETKAKICEIMRTVSSSVERLIEYRCALITAAVTGQIKGLR